MVFFKKNTYNLDRIRCFCIEGDDGVGKTTFIKNVMKNSGNKKFAYIHMPSNITYLVDKDFDPYLTHFDNFLKNMNNYKDFTTTMNQECLLQSVAVGYNILTTILTTSYIIIQDRGIISNIVYKNYKKVKDRIHYRNIDNKISQSYDFIKYHVTNFEDFIDRTLHVVLDNRTFKTDKGDTLFLTNKNLMRFHKNFTVKKESDRIKNGYLDFLYYYKNNSKKEFNFTKTIVVGKYFYYNKKIDINKLKKEYHNQNV